MNAAIKDVKIVILVAGVGSRLMPLTRNTPKSLLDLGDGYTLLERQLKSIGECGVKDVVLVTGYRSEQIEAKIRLYADFNFQVIYNPFYNIANNIASAWLGLLNINEPVVLLNGDDLFKASVLGNLLKSEKEITMVISRKDEFDDDDMKVITEGPLIRDVGKDIEGAKANGESIGMMLFRKRGLMDMRNSLMELIRVEDNLKTFYLQALRNLMRKGHDVHFSECKPEDWAEMDFHPDLTQMRQQLGSKLPS